MKKTLLMAAAALAATVISTQAQTVYSQNVVGYVNQPIPAHSYQIVGSSLINGSDVNQTNGDINATLVNGLISSPNDVGIVPFPANCTNSQMIYWSGTGYTTYYYYNAADATAWYGGTPMPAGWYTLGGEPVTLNLNNGHATFIFNNSGVPMTVTTVGTVFQGTNVYTAQIKAGYNMLNSVVPIATNPAAYLPSNLTSVLGGFPGAPGDYVPDLAHNDSLVVWNGGFTTYYYFSAADATSWYGGTPTPAGFYTLGGDPMPSSSYPQVNQGFFLWHLGSTINWTNSFSVQ